MRELLFACIPNDLGVALVVESPKSEPRKDEQGSFDQDPLDHLGYFERTALNVRIPVLDGGQPREPSSFLAYFNHVERLSVGQPNAWSQCVRT